MMKLFSACGSGCGPRAPGRSIGRIGGRGEAGFFFFLNASKSPMV